MEVVTGFPNYPSGILYPGYRLKIIQREQLDGVRVTRLPLYPSHDLSAIRRVANYSSFAVSALIYSVFFARKPDVIYAYHPPLTVGLAAIVIRFFRRIPLVYDIQDMWPDTLSATGMFSNRVGLKLVGMLCQWVYRNSDRLVVLSEGFRRLLVERGVQPEKISVIHNWCDESRLQRNRQLVKNCRDGIFRILFAGNLGRAQGLEAVIEAAELLEREGSRKIEFVFVGAGIELSPLMEQANRKKLSNVRFMPAVPMNEVGDLLRDADALLVHLRNDPLFSVTIPSKTQAYMAVGKPILMAVRGDAAAIVNESRCGIIAEPSNSRSIADAARRLSDLPRSDLMIMGNRGKDYYFEKLSLSVGTGKFIQQFESVTNIRTHE